MVDNTREARYADAIWPHERHGDILAAVMVVADEEQAGLRAEIERLTQERDRAREDCGLQRGLKESIREEFYAFIRLKATLEGAAK